jgi:phage FluMu protein Com
MLRAARQDDPHESGKIRWLEMRCVHCGRLLQKIEQDAIRPGKRIEIKCSHCKIMNYWIGRPPVSS